MTSRLVALGALVVAVVLVFVLLTGGSSYTINARFIDAGQMVKGGLVEVGGRSIGTVSKITLTENGQANIKLNISDDKYNPLYRGTIARIRTVGLSGVANRFIEVTPGVDTNAKIPDGGTLSTAETRPIVDLDVLFDSLDKTTRDHLQGFIRSGAQLFDTTATAANSAFGYLAPVLSQSDALFSELASDRVAVSRLLNTGATTASALATRRDDIESGISSTATTLRAIAAERAALADTFSRAPKLLERDDGVLGGLKNTVNQLRPALREARPVTPRLARVLRALVPTAQAAVPVLAQTRQLLPLLTTDLNKLPQLARTGVPALKTTTTAIISGQPLIDGLRPFVPDLVNGFFNGLGGRTAGYYDANGGFGRISLQGSTGTLAGLLGGVGAVVNNGTITGYASGKDARCPGGAAAPAPDKSNPYIDKTSICDPADDATR
jgi:phospholipid/cholesterol/gamma-HCH transport system substrate-binding protein